MLFTQVNMHRVINLSWFWIHVITTWWHAARSVVETHLLGTFYTISSAHALRGWINSSVCHTSTVLCISCVTAFNAVSWMLKSFLMVSSVVVMYDIPNCGRVTHICISKLDHHWFTNSLSPGRHRETKRSSELIMNGYYLGSSKEISGIF